MLQKLQIDLKYVKRKRPVLLRQVFKESQELFHLNPYSFAPGFSLPFPLTLLLSILLLRFLLLF